MNLALLVGNKFNPWHFKGYSLLNGAPRVTVFRAKSEIRDYSDERSDSVLGFNVEPIYFDIEVANPVTRFVKRRLGLEPRILPFHQRLRDTDIIQSWDLSSEWSIEALQAHEKFSIPLLVMVWDNIPFNMEHSRRRVHAKQRLIAGADHFVVHTERSRRMLDIEGVTPDRVTLVPPGVDTEAFSPGPGARADFGIAEDEFVILFVGWFLQRKGIDFLLFALRELIEDLSLRKQKIRLLAVGAGPGKERVDTLVERLHLGQHCTFAGALPYAKMPDVFRSANVFVLPSVATPQWQEQFGMALIEAMASGLPVVATRCGAIPEIAGESALLCQPADFLALAESLKQMITEPNRRAELAESGRARAAKLFNLRNFAAEMSTVYDQLLPAS